MLCFAKVACLFLNYLLSIMDTYFSMIKGLSCIYRSDKEPIGIIILENSSVQLTEGGDSPFTFSIQFTGEGSRVYKFIAESEASCMKWINALKNCSYR